MTSTTLTSNIGPCPGSGVTVGKDDIALNCAGHRITGAGYAGIGLTDRTRVTIRNCKVSGFTIGFNLVNTTFAVLRNNFARNDSDGFHIVGIRNTNVTLIGNVAQGSTYYGFFVNGDSNTLVRTPRVTGTGQGFIRASLSTRFAETLQMTTGTTGSKCLGEEGRTS